MLSSRKLSPGVFRLHDDPKKGSKFLAAIILLEIIGQRMNDTKFTQLIRLLLNLFRHFGCESVMCRTLTILADCINLKILLPVALLFHYL